ncbi:TetR/AcrR family transcriptional regulator [Streptomyces sp. NPDC047002]|uniref:TetR/AcrR family transcriptional regulator n=1 Tax=Streptomyces sp. NPDC047002 TaxID=3155475 RepID=UPI0034529C10
MSPRPYRSTVRERAAASTRNAILDAAESLFAEHGYPRVSVSRVAEAAEVAAGTVYASFGSKPALVVGLMERAAAEAAVSRMLVAVEAAADGREIVALSVSAARRLVARHQRALAVLYDNASADPHIAAAVESAETLQRERFDRVVARLDALGALRPGSTPKEAALAFEYFLGPASWRRLRALGWSWHGAEAWLTDQVAYALLGAPGGAAPL